MTPAVPCVRCSKPVERGPLWCDACADVIQEQREARRLRVNEQHNALLMLSCDVGRKVLELHARQTHGDCVGCPDGWRVDWPCDTYQLVAEHYGVTFTTAEGQPGPEMIVPGRSQ